MNIEESLAISFRPNNFDPNDEYGSGGTMDIPVDGGGVVRRWEDGSAFFFEDLEKEGKRLAWGRFDPMNPDYDANRSKARRKRGRAKFI